MTVCPVRTWTRAPARGTLPPSHVAASDQGPLLAERIHAGASLPWSCAVRGRTAPPASRALRTQTSDTRVRGDLVMGFTLACGEEKSSGGSRRKPRGDEPDYPP